VTYSAIEPVIYGVASWFAEYLPDYLAKANDAMASWPDGVVLPALLDPPPAASMAPTLRKVILGTTIPASGPFPCLLVAFDSVDLEAIGQNSDRVTLHLKLVAAIQENNEARILPDTARYMDALAHAVGENLTLGGLVDEAKIPTIEKDEVPANGTGFVIADLSATFEMICD
jgi:hypothetical protein